VVHDLQAPSGTAFDPSPQFWVDRVELDGAEPLVVFGRCFFGSVRVGLHFDHVARRRRGGWPQSSLAKCYLRVTEIQAYGRLTDEIGQMLSALLVLSGEAPECLGPNTILVAVGNAHASEAGQQHLDLRPHTLLSRPSRRCRVLRERAWGSRVGVADRVATP
jgi:hypothetical protein